MERNACESFTDFEQSLDIQPFCLIRIQILMLRPSIPVFEDEGVLNGKREMGHHLARPSISHMPGRGDFTFPTVAMYSSVLSGIENCAHEK